MDNEIREIINAFNRAVTEAHIIYVALHKKEMRENGKR